MIAIIGGSGFIGSRLASLFELNEKPFVIIDKKIVPYLMINIVMVMLPNQIRWDRYFAIVLSLSISRRNIKTTYIQQAYIMM